jgi:hypothetical protein
MPLKRRDRIVAPSPLFNQSLFFKERSKDLAAKEIIAQLSVE